MRALSAFFTLLCIFPLYGLDPTLEEIFAEERLCPLNLSSPPSLDVAKSIVALAKRLDLHTISDLGCAEGDLAENLTEFTYLGIDVLPPKNHKFPFIKKDITSDPLPRADLVIARDCLTYLSYVDLFRALKRIQESKSTYLLLTTSRMDENRESVTGIKRPLNFEIEPFYFPVPLSIIRDGKTLLGLWRIENLNLARLHGFIFPPLSLFTKALKGPFLWEHPAVAGSLRRGLKKIHENYNDNVDHIEHIKENVVILNISAPLGSPINIGLQAIDWKREGRVKTILVGPNVGFPDDPNADMIHDPLVNGMLCPSKWQKIGNIAAQDLPAERIFVWYSGVNEQEWKPQVRFPNKRSKQVLLYCKTHPEISSKAEQLLKSEGYTVKKIIYGSYLPAQYKSALEESLFAVFVSRSESQGLALAEAWSMDVPTLVWNSKPIIYCHNGAARELTAAPYLNPSVGKEWNSFDEFEELLRDFQSYAHQFHPRRWVLLNMTDKISAQLLLSHIRSVGKLAPPLLKLPTEASLFKLCD